MSYLNKQIWLWKKFIYIVIAQMIPCTDKSDALKTYNIIYYD